MQQMRLMLVLLPLLAGCRAGSTHVDVPSIWTGPIKKPADARREVDRQIDCVDVPTPEVPDPRWWSAEEPSGERLQLSEALVIAMTNSPIVRTLPSNRNPVSTQTPRADRPQTNFDPTIEANRVEGEMGRFDAILEADVGTDPVSRPPDSLINGSTRRASTRDRALARAGVRKRTIYGGEASVGLRTDYQYLPETDSTIVNPQYQPDLGFELRQQLSRGAGWSINSAPIFIVAAEASQSSWEFHDAVQEMTRSVEASYWALYQAQASARAIRAVIPMLQEVVRVADANVRADVAIPADLAQAQSELLDFQRQYVEAMLVVRNRQALLRELLGVPPNSVEPLAIETPDIPSEPEVDWEQTLEVAMRNRPDIMRERLAVYIAKRTNELADNQTRSEIEAYAGLHMNGLGDDLGSALELLGEGRYTELSAGLSYQFPLGNHTARARQRSARLLYARETARLNEVVHEAVHELSRILFEAHSLAEQYALAAQRQVEVQRWLDGARARYMNPSKDMSLVRSLDLYLRAIREAAEVQQEVASLTAQYQVSLTELEEAKGTLLAQRNIFLRDNPVTGVKRMIEIDLDQVDEPVEQVPATGELEQVPSSQPDRNSDGSDQDGTGEVIESEPKNLLPEEVPIPWPEIDLDGLDGYRETPAGKIEASGIDHKVRRLPSAQATGSLELPEQWVTSELGSVPLDSWQIGSDKDGD